MPQIGIQHASPDELVELTKLEHSYETSYVWQMERYEDTGDISINLREVRLPRAITVDYPRPGQILNQELQHKSLVLTATIGQNLVGYIAVNEQSITKTAWISDLVVDKLVRRQGIGSALVLSTHEWANRRRLRWMTLEMQSKNHPAICFAKKMGYEFCGFNDHYYVNQDIAIFFGSNIR
jgi:ribosomal protein S18 acetylase RimI-like enzyme